MNNPRVTVAVVPREGFSGSTRCLDSIYSNSAVPFNLVFVDGGSPGRIRRHLEQESERRGFKLIRTEHYLSPNEARNLATAQVDTDYVVFIDNDAIVDPGWLGPLVRCADETGAWVVGPTHLIGGSKKRTVHVAGGQMQFSTRDGRRYFRESHGHMNENLPDVAAGLSRTECDFIEFHCMLVWTDALRRLGPLDEALLSTSEHLDFCIQVKDAGGGVYHEPASTVVYVPRFLMPWSDVRYFLLRWSDEWNRSSLRHFQTKHGIADDDCFLSGRYAWLNSHRRWPMRFFTKPVKWIFGKSISEALDRRLDPLILVLTPKERRRQIQVGPFPWTDMAGH